MKTFKIIFIFFLVVFFIRQLGAWEDKRLEMWAGNLKNENSLIRKSAAKNLGSLGQKEAVPYLVEALNDEEAEVRATVCEALGQIGDEPIKKKLKNVLYNDSSPMVKDAAKKAIDEINAYLEKLKEKKIKEMKQKLKDGTLDENGVIE